MATANPTPADLRAAFSYDPASGTLTRISGQRPGHPVGYRCGNGYSGVQFRGKSYLFHRVAWCVQTGAWPIGQIDHINGDKSDNRLANLRDVTPQANSQNQHRARKNNSTRKLGATKTASGRYMARMFVGGRRLYLGLHDTPEAAHEAYAKAKLVQNFTQQGAA